MVDPSAWNSACLILGGLKMQMFECELDQFDDRERFYNHKSEVI